MKYLVLLAYPHSGWEHMTPDQQAESMNDIVGELIALVGGSTKKTASSGPRQSAAGRKLSHADHLYHKIAGGKSKKAHAVPTKSAAEKSIPLGDDSELNDFNS